MVRKPLKDQLAQAGIFSMAGGLPLAGDSAEEVFSALCLAIGSGCLLDSFRTYAGLMWEHGWDGSFDGMETALDRGCREDDPDFNADDYLDALYQVYVQPFLLLDRYRRTQEEYAGQIAEIYAENEQLRQTLNAGRREKDGEQ